MNRRMFNFLLASGIAASRTAWASPATARIAFYASIGPELTLYDVDADSAALTRKSSVQLPGNLQYAWPHPSRGYLYTVSSNGEPGGGDAPKGDVIGTARIAGIQAANFRVGPEVTDQNDLIDAARHELVPCFPCLRACRPSAGR